MTPENWNGILIDTVHARGFVSALYMVPLNLVGHYIVELVFLAILLSNIPDDDLHALKDDDEHHHHVTLKSIAKSFMQRVKEAARNHIADQKKNASELQEDIDHEKKKQGNEFQDDIQPVESLGRILPHRIANEKAHRKSLIEMLETGLENPLAAVADVFEL
jgi:hypothetical protein